jgi:hypothetical protein
MIAWPGFCMDVILGRNGRGFYRVRSTEWELSIYSDQVIKLGMLHS